MLITNGTVSRTFKPADYEVRSVTLSFTMDPGEDVEACVAQAMAMAERQARGAAPVPVAEPAKQPRKPPAAVVVAEAPERVVLSAEEAQVEAPLLVTDAVLDAAVKKARAGNIAPEQIKAAILVFTGQPGVSMKSLDQEKRVALVAAIEALKPLAHESPVVP